jgi:16S rRNA (uracil1498-N3)-methyltransferase
VSAPLFLIDAFPPGDTVTLDGPEGHHAANVQRLRPGEPLVIADGKGGTATARVTDVGRGTVTATIEDRTQQPPPHPRLIVAQGIPKGDRGELAVQAMTETGVDEIIPWAAARSVTQWRGDRGHKSRAKWTATAREATKQARRPWLPTIAGTPDCSTRQLAARLPGTTAFVLHEEASARLTTAPLPDTTEILLVIGPEGGIADAELDLFRTAGATPARLGDAILRTSTAGVAALAVLSTRLGRW